MCPKSGCRQLSRLGCHWRPSTSWSLWHIVVLPPPRVGGLAPCVSTERRMCLVETVDPPLELLGLRPRYGIRRESPGHLEVRTIPAAVSSPLQ